MNPNILKLKLRVKKLLSRLDRLRPARADGINQHEYRVFSQHREDGIIEFLLRHISNPTKKFVEFGFGPEQSNCLNLALQAGYCGLFLDGDAGKVNLARTTYEQLMGDRIRLEQAFLCRDTLNQRIQDNGFQGEVDVLSIDVDGNDYWFWQAMEVINPRLVVIEYNASLGPDRSLTVPYDSGFVRYEKHPSGLYHGASLMALDKLGQQRGYRLTACDSTGVNAFFLRNDIAKDRVAGQSARQTYFPHRGRTLYKKMTAEQQFNAIADMPFIEITNDTALLK